MKHTVADFKKLDLEAGALEMVKPPQVSFKVVVEMDRKMDKQAAKDPLLLSEFRDTAKEQLEATKKIIQQKCRVFDKLFVGMVEKGADKKLMEKQMKGLNDAIKNDIKVCEKAAELAAMKVWTDFVAKKKEWNKFKLKVGVSIGGTIASFAVSLGLMLSSPFTGGASAAFAIIGFIKSATTLVQDIRKLATGLETDVKDLKRAISFVGASAKEKGLFTANEVSAAVLKEFLGVSQTSIKDVGTYSENVKAKYAKMTVNAHSVSKNLDKVLKSQEKLESDFLKEVAKRLKKHPVKDKSGEMRKAKVNFDKAVSKSAAAVQQAIDKIGDILSEIKDWAPKIKQLLASVKQLEMKDTKALKTFREGLKLVALSTAVFDGNKIAQSAGDLAGNFAEAGSGYAFDKISSLALDGTVLDAA